MFSTEKVYVHLSDCFGRDSFSEGGGSEVLGCAAMVDERKITMPSGHYDNARDLC